MIIGDEIKRLAFLLQLNRRPHHPEIIADVQDAAGLNAGENSHRSVYRNSKRFLDFARNDKLVQDAAGLDAGQNTHVRPQG